MKKSLLALAVLGAFAGAASAQSSVTVFGKLDQAIGKKVGSADNEVMDTGGSRLGFRGTEDLGGGMSAVFSFEHRFSPDTGCDATTACGGATGAGITNTFWQGHSWVGIKSSMGTLTLGRHYTAGFLLIQNQIDPFSGDTVAALRDVGVRPVGTTVRVANSVKYDFSASGFSVGATLGEAIGPKRPVSIAGNYAAGPLFVGVGYENPSDASDFDSNVAVGARYDFGVVNLRGSVSSAKNTADARVRSFLVGLTAPVGSGLIKAGWAQNKVTGGNKVRKLGLGYQHNLSKRTFLYADVANQSTKNAAGVNIQVEKTGYDFGIQHNF